MDTKTTELRFKSSEVLALIAHAKSCTHHAPSPKQEQQLHRNIQGNPDAISTVPAGLWIVKATPGGLYEDMERLGVFLMSNGVVGELEDHLLSGLYARGYMKGGDANLGDLGLDFIKTIPIDVFGVDLTGEYITLYFTDSDAFVAWGATPPDSYGEGASTGSGVMADLKK